ncbi:hypothetical protein B0T20DRAFT_231367 [Sordaria brevicollis]|uniref:Uncharacterized protein n=1 Tax=Sordaria brevicollis TaxID=83679 RepID=A0AAE0PD43_SORBR|nr:hypothetical protein B0T20DRAFT_231367 [Sordaria brevicollis]
MLQRIISLSAPHLVFCPPLPCSSSGLTFPHRPHRPRHRKAQRLPWGSRYLCTRGIQQGPADRYSKYRVCVLEPSTQLGPYQSCLSNFLWTPWGCSSFSRQFPPFALKRKALNGQTRRLGYFYHKITLPHYSDRKGSPLRSAVPSLHWQRAGKRAAEWHTLGRRHPPQLGLSLELASPQSASAHTHHLKVFAHSAANQLLLQDKRAQARTHASP